MGFFHFICFFSSLLSSPCVVRIELCSSAQISLHGTEDDVELKIIFIFLVKKLFEFFLSKFSLFSLFWLDGVVNVPRIIE
jgi:hypothetical protein